MEIFLDNDYARKRSREDTSGNLSDQILTSKNSKIAELLSKNRRAKRIVRPLEKTRKEGLRSIAEKKTVKNKKENQSSDSESNTTVHLFLY